MTREELLKVGKPILFNTEMTKAILNGRKTCTRRAIKLDLGLADTDKNDSSYLKIPDEYGDCHDAKDLCRYQVGDYLYVRETWCKVGEDVDSIFFEDSGAMYNGQVLYRADGIDLTDIGKWRPSIHMPKSAARIFLKVTDVRVERLQDIDINGVIEEGIKATGPLTWTCVDFLETFVELWNSTIKKKDLDIYGFGANPFVWIIEFERVEVE